MADIYYLIRTPTLRAIADAAKQAGVETAINIPDETSHDLYYVLESTLKALADIVREYEGSTADIPVLELAERLLAMIATAKKLATPVIRLEEVSDGTDEPIVGATPAILGLAVLGRTILGVTEVGEQLAKPTIYLVASGGKLEAPTINLVEVSEDEPDTPVQLSTPIISLVEVADGEEEPEDLTITLTIEGDDLQWTSVEGASKYYVFAYDGENSITFVMGAATSCLLSGLSLESGIEYELSASAVDESGNVLCESNTVVYEVPTSEEPVTQLAAPAIELVKVAEEIAAPVVNIDGDTLSWAAVVGATQYMVISDGGGGAPVITPDGTQYYLVTTTEETSINLAERTSTWAAGNYTFYAIASNGDVGSDISNGVTYTVAEPEITKLATPSISLAEAVELTIELSLEDGVLLWTPISWAANHYVRTYDITEDLGYMEWADEAGRYPLSELGLESGHEYKFTVIAQTSTGTTICESNEIVYYYSEKLAAPTIKLGAIFEAPVLTLNGDILSWSAVDGAEYYVVNGTTGSAVYNLGVPSETSLDLTKVAWGSDRPYGEYSIGVTATSSSVEVLYCYSSNHVTYTAEEPVILAAPVATLDGDTLSWNAVDGATGYWVLSDIEEDGGLKTTIGDSDYGLVALQAETTVNLAEKLSGEASGERTIYVIALGEDSASSGFSNGVTYTIE